MKGQITGPYVLMLAISIILVASAIFIMYNFIPNGFFTQKYIIYNVKTNLTETTFYTNFNAASIFNITLISDNSNVIFPSTSYSKEIVNNNQYIITYNVGIPTSFGSFIAGGYVYNNQGVKIPLEFINNKIQEVIPTNTVPYLIITSSSYFVSQGSQVTITPTTNLLSPTFNYFINNEQITNCQNISTACTFTANYGSGSELDILVYAYNSTYTSGISKSLVIYVN